LNNVVDLTRDFLARFKLKITLSFFGGKMDFEKFISFHRIKWFPETKINMMNSRGVLQSFSLMKNKISKLSRKYLFSKKKDEISK